MQKEVYKMFLKDTKKDNLCLNKFWGELCFGVVLVMSVVK